MISETVARRRRLQDEEPESVWNRLRSSSWGHALRLTRTRPPSRETTTRFGHAVQQTARRALLGRSGPRSVAIGGRAEGLDIQDDAVGAELRLRFGQRAVHGTARLASEASFGVHRS